MRPRKLSAAERALIHALLDHAGLAKSRFAASLPKIRVIDDCGCGCPSVALSEPGVSRKIERVGPALVDMFGRTRAGTTAGVLLFANKQRLTYLEIYSQSRRVARTLPTITSLVDPGWVKISRTAYRATNEAKR